MARSAEGCRVVEHGSDICLASGGAGALLPRHDRAEGTPGLDRASCQLRFSFFLGSNHQGLMTDFSNPKVHVRIPSMWKTTLKQRCFGKETPRWARSISTFLSKNAKKRSTVAIAQVHGWPWSPWSPWSPKEEPWLQG